MTEEKKEEPIGSWTVKLNGEELVTFFSKDSLTEFINKRAMESPMLINELAIKEVSMSETIAIECDRIQTAIENFGKIAEENAMEALDVCSEKLQDVRDEIYDLYLQDY